MALRPWGLAGDAAALAAAWADPAIVATCAVPADRSEAAAQRWIDGWTDRASAGLALDLVVGPLGDDPDVWGEVGMTQLHHDTLELGWWTARDHRGRGLASTAVRLVVEWLVAVPVADGRLPVTVVARVPAGHVSSERVAADGGLAPRGYLADDRRLWVRRLRPTATT